MHLRRALLLFAIVLGLAALASSVSRPPDERGRKAPSPAPVPGPQAKPGPGAGKGAELRFVTGGRRETVRLAAGRSATMTVQVPEPGQVELADESRAADPLTPARFDLLATEPGRLVVRFSPAGGGETQLVGTLKIEG